MFPCVEKKIELIERYPEEKFLVTYRKAKRIRTWLATADFRNHIEIVSKLINLVLIKVCECFYVGTAVTISAKITENKLCSIGCAGHDARFNRLFSTVPSSSLTWRT